MHARYDYIMYMLICIQISKKNYDNLNQDVYDNIDVVKPSMEYIYSI